MPTSNLGLSSEEAHKRLIQYGPNCLPERQSDSLAIIFLRQFNSPFIYILLLAALVSFGLDHTLNGLFVCLVLLINATIGSVQEHSAKRAADALQQMVPQFASVIRDGITQKLEVSHLVPGDLVLLVSGDKVPADLDLHQAQNLLINESLLTGESLSVAKTSKDIREDISQTGNQAYAGTLVTHGRARGKVTHTGTHTQIGKIAKSVSGSERVKPPLLQRVEKFTLRISYSVLIIIALLFIITLFRGADLTAVFLLGVALAVSAIPEGLPAAITIALAIGMRRMAKANVIVRKLVAVETLGSCTCIATDKTGTLTVNEMTVNTLLLPDGSLYRVSGAGVDPHGEIISESGTEPPNKKLRYLILAGLLANEAEFNHKNSEWQFHGDGVDIAFLVLASKAGFNLATTRNQFPELDRIPYESENAFSASLNRVNGHLTQFVKGSAERLMAMCNIDVDGKPLNYSHIEQQVSELSAKGYRVLALATGSADDKSETDYRFNSNTPPQGLTFLGLAGMIDPLRPEARTAVKQCREANIDVIMITGDHPKTAHALACELGISSSEAPVITGSQIKELEEEPAALSSLIKSSRVFARIEPTQKLQIVQHLMDDGHFVAVTGDGVNDAPALHNAHVGIAMGKRGTDVARESSELIVTDDRFDSIVNGIEQGRLVYNNIRKVVFLLISTGAGEITLFLLSIFSGLPLPLYPLQLLWLNLVTNGIQDVALAFEPAEGSELKKPPRPPQESIFNRVMIERVFINSLVIGCLAFATFFWALSAGMDEFSARNMTLLLMVLFENVHVLNSRSETQSIFSMRFFGNPFLVVGMLAAQAIHITAMYTPGLKTVLQLQPVSLQQWSTLLLVALLLIVVDEGLKRIRKRHSTPSISTLKE